MIGSFIKKIVGSKNDREIKRMYPVVDRICSLEPSVAPLSDQALREKTDEFRCRLSDTPSNGKSPETLDDLLPEAFAVLREASRRVLSMRHFDVQLLGGLILHEGKIAEMKTGEGKTLVATLPIYLNALSGRGGHLITVNDYLAKRDSQWMGEVYRFLGLTVGLIQHDLDDQERQKAYACDVTYGTNNEFGFDYLRDNMKFDPTTFVQRELHYAIVDEVDSILVDEARTPLIISGPAEESTDFYYRVNQIIPSLKAERDYTIEEKTKTVTLTEDGNARVEKLLGVENLYDLSNMSLVHHVHQALRAHALFKRDVDYVVKDGEVLIVDEFTGRLMPGRRWSDGLHQAVEAKEGVKIANENQTLATITFQNYFRMYKRLAGMTGTADTEAAEFSKIYNLDVVVAPTNRPMIRTDYSDVIYRTEREKFSAIVNEIEELYKVGRPVLVGTISIEKSEHLSVLLKKKGVSHSVLNAKYHEKEAEIIAQAGSKGAVTIATNMAGRGTDILLGGNPDFLFKRYLIQHPDLPIGEKERVQNKIRQECEAEKVQVVALGGLHIIGTERHESRRIDNQLRGRAGRQGDPGSSHFYLSLEDDLLRIFGSERISNLMGRMGMEEGVPIEHRWVTRAIENAQKRVEGHNFDIRKQLLEYDDVMNRQREVIYTLRRQVLFGEELSEEIGGMIDGIVDEFLKVHCSEEAYPEDWDLKGLGEALSHQFSMDFGPVLSSFSGAKETGRELLKDELLKQLRDLYKKKEEEFTPSVMRSLEKMILLRMIDTHWKDHLLSMDNLKEGIGLRGYGQKDPLAEYKREGFEMFSEMIARMEGDALAHLFRVQVVREERGPASVFPGPRQLQLNRGGETATQPLHREGKKVGRNELCPCGSGKKYKKCCGK
jgi:preprotein translocase subunit SecA